MQHCVSRSISGLLIRGRRNADSRAAPHSAARGCCVECPALRYHASGYPLFGGSATGSPAPAADSGNSDIVALICSSTAEVQEEEREGACRAAFEGEYYRCAAGLHGEQFDGDIRLLRWKDRHAPGKGESERHTSGKARLREPFQRPTQRLSR